MSKSSLSVRAGSGQATIRFTLSRAATVKVQIETPGGIVVRALPAAKDAAGGQAVVWDGTLTAGTHAYSGKYVAHVFATSESGTSDLVTSFSYARG